MSTTVTSPPPPSPPSSTFRQWVFNNWQIGAWTITLALIGALYASILSNITDARKDAQKAQSLAEETQRTLFGKVTSSLEDHTKKLQDIDNKLQVGLLGVQNNQENMKENQRDLRSELRHLSDRVNYFPVSPP